VTTVYITHERHEALTLGDRVAVLYAGEIVQEGAPWHVFSHPATVALARFVGAEITLPGTVQATGDGMVQVVTPVGTVAALADFPCGTHVTLCLRPEHLGLHRPGQSPQPSSACNVVQGTLARITPWGPHMRVTIDCGLPLVALTTRCAVAALGLAPGLPVLVTFAASAVHVMRTPQSQ
jgi:ABC-type Fe3+/spermidine/putrescine transport system ATPase subunit